MVRKATKLEALRMECRTLYDALVNVRKQWYQLSRELRHLPSIILFGFFMYGQVNPPPVEAPYELSCPVCPSASVTVYPCELPPTGASID